MSDFQDGSAPFDENCIPTRNWRVSASSSSALLLLSSAFINRGLKFQEDRKVHQKDQYFEGISNAWNLEKKVSCSHHLQKYFALLGKHYRWPVMVPLGQTCVQRDSALHEAT